MKLIKTEDDKKKFEELKNMKPRSFVSLSKKKELYAWVKSKTPKLQDGKHRLSTMVYWILHDIDDFPPCKYAKPGETCELGLGMVYSGDVRNCKKGYVGACCQECVKLKAENAEKRKKTCLEKYGVDNFLKSDEYKKQFKKWLDERGVVNPFQLESVKEKSNKTRKERYGYEYTMQSPEKRKLASDNYLKKTGYTHQYKNPEIKAKIKRVLDSKTYEENEDIRLRKLATLRCKFYDRMCKCETVPLFSREEFSTVTKKEISLRSFKWRCTKCGNEFESQINYNNMKRFKSPARCLKCHPFSFEGVSNNERTFDAFVSSCYSGEILTSDRTLLHPYEVDIYIPERKLAFEYDGLFWHNSINKPDNYHLEKTERCEERGVQLIHVFEDEWLNKRPIVESRVKNLFGVYDKTVYARKCSVVDVDSKTSRAFQDENHLQGSVSAKMSLGLECNGELVSLMTFGKSRFSKKYDWELLRFCNKLGYHVPGAASRLLKHFERQHHGESLVSYADRRWSTGNLYRKLGFSLDHKSRPNYFYQKGQMRYSRVAFQKHKLKDVLKVFNSAQTEVENMMNNGYYRIFDCGNLVFTKTIE